MEVIRIRTLDPDETRLDGRLCSPNAPVYHKTLQRSDVRCMRDFSYFQALAALDEFANLDRDIEGSAKRWKKFVEHESPEKEKFPQEWKNKSALQKLCMMRALRPDRMTYAVKCVLA